MDLGLCNTTYLSVSKEYLHEMRAPVNVKTSTGECWGRVDEGSGIIMIEGTVGHSSAGL
jgi:hypothetical protein